jgi:hypothetical protein
MREKTKYIGSIVFCDIDNAKEALKKFVELEKRDSCVYCNTLLNYIADDCGRTSEVQKIKEYTLRHLDKVFPDSPNIIELLRYNPKNYINEEDVPEEDIVEKEIRLKSIIEDIKNMKSS